MDNLLRAIISIAFGFVVYTFLSAGWDGVVAIPDTVSEFLQNSVNMISNTEFGEGFKQGFDEQTRKLNGN